MYVWISILWNILYNLLIMCENLALFSNFVQWSADLIRSNCAKEKWQSLFNILFKWIHFNDLISLFFIDWTEVWKCIRGCLVIYRNVLKMFCFWLVFKMQIVERYYFYHIHGLWMHYTFWLKYLNNLIILGIY